MWEELALHRQQVTFHIWRHEGKDLDVEEILSHWFSVVTECGLPLSGPMLKSKLKELVKKQVTRISKQHMISCHDRNLSMTFSSRKHMWTLLLLPSCWTIEICKNTNFSEIVCRWYLQYQWNRPVLVSHHYVIHATDTTLMGSEIMWLLCFHTCQQLMAIGKSTKL